MNAVSASVVYELRPRILERRARLQSVAGTVSLDYVNDLLAEVDAALERIDQGSYGLCETCHDPIEADRLERNPLARFCLDHLSAAEMRAHEEDLELAMQIQANLLPAKNIAIPGWETCYRYEPAGVVGGDYCELVSSADGKSLFFAVGDVTGKGVAASLLMTHLSAIFRSLLSLDLPLAETMSRANRLFSESTPATHYATLAAGRAIENGLELCSAGQCRPLLLRRGGASRIDASGLPLGLFGSCRYTVENIRLDPGEALVLYSDGVTEANDTAGSEYEEERLVRALTECAGSDASGIADAILRDVAAFRGAAPQHDDITVLVMRRKG